MPPIRKPFFEIGPKLFLYGDEAVDFARFADEVSRRYDIDIIFTAQYTDIWRIAQAVTSLHVFAQHMDPAVPGPGVGGVLPEALKAAGAEGVLLNHAERPIPLGALNETLTRARIVGLTTLVCANTPEEGAAIAALSPDIILAESPLLIGGGKRSPDDAQEIARINRLIGAVDRRIPVLHGAGIRDEEDIYQVIAAGAEASGSTSGIFKAERPKEMLEKMIAAMRRAWDEHHADK